MRVFAGLLKSFLLLVGLTFVFSHSSYAQTARKFAAKPVVVRLCPANCIAVNGHGFKPNAAVSVLETSKGWARVSSYLDRSKLVKSFGAKITAKPALWVALSSLQPVATPTAAKKPAPKPVAKKKVSVVDKVARLRRAPLPKFRPNQTTRVESVADVVAVPEVPVVEEPKAEVQQVAQQKPVKVIESTQPIVVKEAGSGSSKALSWEDVQARIANQKKKLNSASTVKAVKDAKAKRDSDAAKAALVAANAAKAKKQADAKKATDAKRVVAEKARQAAEKVRQARVRAKVKAKLAELDAAKAKAKADAVKAAQAKAKTDAAKTKIAATKAKAAAAKAENEKARADAAKAKIAANKAKVDAAKAAAVKTKQEAAKVAAAKSAAAKAKAANVAKAKAAAAAKLKADNARIAEAKLKAEQARIAAVKANAAAAKAAQEAKAAKTAKKKEGVGYTPPTKDATEQVAALTPAKGPEPVFSSAKADPIALGPRPKKLTNALLDKRLRKLPGKKAKRIPLKIRIALRHYAKSLLDSNECAGIAKGGASAVPGMLYVACTDDPSYLRQFPVEEESW